MTEHIHAPMPCFVFSLLPSIFHRNVPGSSAANVKESWKLKKEISTKMKKSTMKLCSIIQHSLYHPKTVRGL